MLSWGAPESLKGEFIAAPEVKMGPFPVEVGPGLPFLLDAGRLQLPEPKAGNRAPDFALLAADARMVHLGFLRDRPAVVGFFCRCASCQATARALSKQEAIGDRSRLLAVFTDPEIAATAVVEEFRAATGFSGPVMLDQTGAVTESYQSKTGPRVFLVGRDGRILYASTPATPPDQLAREVAAALQAPTP